MKFSSKMDECCPRLESLAVQVLKTFINEFSLLRNSVTFYT